MIMDSMAVFKNTVLTNICSYRTNGTINDVTYNSVKNMTDIYNSLPDGLEYIGSDCFYYTRSLSYIYIPASVKYIGHHAFWDAVYKEDKELHGITCINVEADEKSFEECTKGDQWRPQYDYMLFKKSVDINYSEARK